LNIDSSSYLVTYGPNGAHLDAASEPPFSFEPALAGHPAAGWDRAADPLKATTLKFVWRVPRLLVRLPDGHWAYRLWWVGLPAHGGDELRLHVQLPSGWRWSGPVPPAKWPLERDARGEWQIRNVGH
jgi:hypothetical protein